MNKEQVCVGNNALKFVESLEKRRNPHIRDYGSCSERGGHIEDYSISQEKKDLERYKHFMNSSAYDDIRAVETEITVEEMKKPTLMLIRKIGRYHDDV